LIYDNFLNPNILQDSNKVGLFQDSKRRRLRNCTKRLLQIAWQRHKAACSRESQRQPFWKIYEAELVLSVWNAVKRNGCDINLQGGPGGSFAEFLARVESFSHPGKSSRFKKHQPVRDAGDPEPTESFVTAKILADEEDWELNAERSELFRSCLLLVQHEELLSDSPAVDDGPPPPAAGIESHVRILL
jgi:hypothetical protein